MKRFILLSAICIQAAVLMAQAPNKMTFQAVVRDNSGTLIISTTVGMRLSILQGSPVGTAVYVETQTPTTNVNGLATLEIGGGTVVSGSISGIDWGAGPYYLKTETDPAGGTTYTITGTAQFLTVPYAFYAATSGTVVLNRTFLYLRKKTTGQTISNNTSTTITNYDANSNSGFSFNNGTGVITFNQKGIYTITVQTSFGASNTGRKIVWLNCSSSLWGTRIASNEMSGDASRITTSFVGQFNANDQISLGVYQNTGATADCPNTTQTFDETLLNIELLYEVP